MGRPSTRQRPRVTSSDETTFETAAEPMKKSRTNNRKQRRLKESELEMIDRHLMARTTLIVKGKKQSMTKLEALAFRVSNMEIDGNAAATRLRIRLKKLERTALSGGVELRFEDNDYTMAFGSSNNKEENA
jgi:hypothetical protein